MQMNENKNLFPTAFEVVDETHADEVMPLDQDAHTRISYFFGRAKADRMAELYGFEEQANGPTRTNAKC